MTLLATMRSTALAFGVLLSLGNAPEALACEGADCQTPAKPLDLKQFMREQAASTRTTAAMDATRGKVRHDSTRHVATQHVAKPHAASPQKVSTHKVARAHHAQSKLATAQQQNAPVAVIPAAQDNATNDAGVQVVTADEVNDIDRAAGPAPAETQGFAPAAEDVSATEQDVQVVVQNAFNDIDRKSAELAQSMAKSTAIGKPATAHGGSAATSWMQWLWSAIGATFVVMAGVARYLFA